MCFGGFYTSAIPATIIFELDREVSVNLQFTIMDLKLSTNKYARQVASYDYAVLSERKRTTIGPSADNICRVLEC